MGLLGCDTVISNAESSNALVSHLGDSVYALKLTTLTSGGRTVNQLTSCLRSNTPLLPLSFSLVKASPLFHLPPPHLPAPLQPEAGTPTIACRVIHSLVVFCSTCFVFSVEPIPALKSTRERNKITTAVSATDDSESQCPRAIAVRGMRGPFLLLILSMCRSSRKKTVFFFSK